MFLIAIYATTQHKNIFPKLFSNTIPKKIGGEKHNGRTNHKRINPNHDKHHTQPTTHTRTRNHTQNLHRKLCRCQNRHRRHNRIPTLHRHTTQRRHCNPHTIKKKQVRSNHKIKKEE